MSQTTLTPDATRATNESVLLKLHAAVNDHNAHAVAALCASEVVWEDPAAPDLLIGRDAVLRFHSDVMLRALPDVKLQMLEGPYASQDGTCLAVRLRISGTMTGPLDPPGFAPTDKSLVFETAEFSRFECGLLVRHRVVLNMLDLARQIGAVPKTGGTFDRVTVWLQHLQAWHARHQP